MIVNEQDYKLVATALMAQLPQCEANEGIVFMGHGTPRDNNKAHGYTYLKMQSIFDELGAPIVVGTVEDEDQPNFDAVLEQIEKRGYQKVHMYPLMVVAGDHANNDMAGDDEDSWKSMFVASEAFESVDAQIAGLGRIADVQAVYVAHTADAIASME